MATSASIHSRLTETLDEASWIVLYIIAIAILVACFAIAVGLAIYMFTRKEEWFAKEENKNKWGFLYLEFTYRGRYFASILLLRQLAFALIMGKNW
jgi:cell division protein FtsX